MTPQITRRTLARGAAWTAPAVALAGAAPALALSPVLDPGVNVATPVTCFVDSLSSDGYIVPGVVVTVADEDGNPIANASVEICVSNWSGNTTTFWFVTDPTLSSNVSNNSGNRKQCGSFTSDANGRIALDDGAGNGYLRKGSDGTREGSIFTVTSTAGNTTFTLTNSTAACNGGSTGTRPAAG